MFASPFNVFFLWNFYKRPIKVKNLKFLQRKKKGKCQIFLQYGKYQPLLAEMKERCFYRYVANDEKKNLNNALLVYFEKIQHTINCSYIFQMTCIECVQRWMLPHNPTCLAVDNMNPNGKRIRKYTKFEKKNSVSISDEAR